MNACLPFLYKSIHLRRIWKAGLMGIIFLVSGSGQNKLEAQTLYSLELQPTQVGSNLCKTSTPFNPRWKLSEVSVPGNNFCLDLDVVVIDTSQCPPSFAWENLVGVSNIPKLNLGCFTSNSDVFQIRLDTWEDDSVPPNCEYNPSTDDCYLHSLLYSNSLGGVTNGSIIEIKDTTTNSTTACVAGLEAGVRLLVIKKSFNVEISGPGYLCNGQQGVLTVSPVSIPDYTTTYTWERSNPSWDTTTLVPFVFVNQPGNYSVEVEVSNGSKTCSVTSTVFTIDELEVPGVSILSSSPNGFVFCQGESSMVSGDLDSSPSAPGTPSYSWTVDGDNYTGQSISVVTDVADEFTYSLEVSFDGYPGCVVEATEDITVECAPEPTITLISNPSASNGKDYCKNDNSARLVGLSQGCTVNSFEWYQGSDPLSAGNGAIQDYILNGLDGNFTLKVTYAGNLLCTNEFTITDIEAKCAPEVTISSPDQPDFEYCENASIQLMAEHEACPGADIEYDWSPDGPDDQTISVSGLSGNTAYSVTVTYNHDGNLACVEDNAEPELVKPLCAPDVAIEGPEPAAFCEGGNAMLSAVPDDPSCDVKSYEWTGGQSTETVSAAAGGTYFVTVTYGHTNKDCPVQSAAFELEEVVVPQGLNPDTSVAVCDLLQLNLPLTPTISNLQELDILSFEWQELPSGPLMSGDTITSVIGTSPSIVSFRIFPYNTSQISGKECAGADYEYAVNVEEVISIDEVSLELLPVIDFCRGVVGLEVALQEVEDQIDYVWSTNISGLEAVFSEDHQRLLLTWPQSVDIPAGTQPKLWLYAKDKCDKSRCIPILLNVLNGLAPQQPEVILLEPENTLVLLDNTADNYQWGFEDKKTLDPTEVPGAVYQDLIQDELTAINHSFDTDNFYYWVRIERNDCWTKVYYNPPSDEDLVPLIDSGEDCFRLTSTSELVLPLFHFRVYPNPGNGYFRVELEEEIPDGAIRADLYDLYGSVVRSLEWMKQANRQQEEIILPDVQAGIYFLRLQLSDGRTAVQKIVLQ